MRRNRRSLRLWLWSLPVALPLAAFLLGNAWLASQPGRAWITGKIQRRTGLEARLEGASLTPWSGIRLRGMELLQPADFRSAVKAPLARIATVRLTPVWSSWLHGKRELRAAELDAPHLVLPAEWLAGIARSQAAPVTAGPPIASAAPPQPPTPTPAPAAPASPPAPPSTPPAAPPPPQAPSITLPPTAWLHLKNASFTLISAGSGKEWLEVSGLTGSIPVAGSPAQSTLVIRTLRSAGNDTLSDLKANLDWSHPVLSLKPFETEIHGLKLALAAKLGLLSGIPLQVEAQLPRQKPPSIALPHQGRAEADAIAANARFRGLVLAPGTWQGELLIEAITPSAHIAGNNAKFDRGSAVTVLRGGMLSCVDARLIGDELSFLGNATLLADGRAAAALRMVAPPENATAIASRIFPSIPQPPSLTPLSTPQRTAFDVHASGNLSQIVLQAGHDGPLIELKQVK